MSSNMEMYFLSCFLIEKPNFCTKNDFILFHVQIETIVYIENYYIVRKSKMIVNVFQIISTLRATHLLRSNFLKNDTKVVYDDWGLIRRLWLSPGCVYILSA